MSARRYANSEQAQVHELHCLWYEALSDAPCRLILVADPKDPAREIHQVQHAWAAASA